MNIRSFLNNIFIAFFFNEIHILHSATTEQDKWNRFASADLKDALNNQPIIKKANNVIFFLGDGMSITTLTTSRILKGQLKNQSGLDGYLSFERFPSMGLLKTYNVDKQVPDSAATATAYLNGVKGNMGTIGVDSNVKLSNCSTYSWKYDVESIFTDALQAKKTVGFVTTARITHATPAALYAHTPDRDWEYDNPRNDDVSPEIRHNCLDIALQFLTNAINFKVVLGGGRQNFFPRASADPEYPNLSGKRTDGRDLVAEWQWKQERQNRKPRYVWNKRGFESIKPTDNEYVLGLFEPSHMQYDIFRNDTLDFGEPSIAEMTKKAIDILSHNSPNGYFLFVEGGRIDHGHHENVAKLALTDTLAMEKAVEVAVSMSKIDETLLLVTSDHSHVFTFGAYPSANVGIFDITDNNQMGKGAGIAQDNKPYTSLAYSNGPSALNDSRSNISGDDLNSANYKQQSLVPLNSETHGGEDVAVFARGPMSHLFHRVHEQNYVAHVIRYASCIGEYSGSKCMSAISNSASSLSVDIYTVWSSLTVFLLICL